jgi:hypothetical protein
VKSISGNTFVLEVSYPKDPTVDASLNERTVSLPEGVSIVRVIRYSPEVIAENMEKFLEAMAEYEKKASKVSPDDTTPFREVPPEYPLTFDREIVDASALQVGQQVTLTTGENARELHEITPTAIEIIPTLAEPSIP